MQNLQEINAPKGERLKWRINRATCAPMTQIVNALQAWDWPNGSVKNCIVGEYTLVKVLLNYVLNLNLLRSPFPTFRIGVN